MNIFASPRRLKVMLAVTGLQAGLLASPLVAQNANAQFAACRSDPVVLLSNGAVVDLSANINADMSSVQKVVYVLHAPVGSRMVAVFNTDGLMGLKETVQFYADDSWNTYDTYTTAYTSAGGVGVTAYSDVISVLGLNLGLRSATGLNSQHLHIRVGSLL